MTPEEETFDEKLRIERAQEAGDFLCRIRKFIPKHVVGFEVVLCYDDDRRLRIEVGVE